MMVATAAIGFALGMGERNVVPPVPDVKHALLLTAGSAFAAFAAFQATSQGREIFASLHTIVLDLLRSGWRTLWEERASLAFVLGLLASVCLAAGTSGLTGYIAFHATGPALVLCIADAALPLAASILGWCAARRPS
jgi:hypothetical protein